MGDVKTNPALAGVPITWPQKVILDADKIPHATFNKAVPAKTEDVWDAQEDIWLLELIFDAIVRTNEDATYVSDAPVRQISKISLLGGSGVSSIAAAASGGEGEGQLWRRRLWRGRGLWQ